jgi:hypothetical protein
LHGPREQVERRQARLGELGHEWTLELALPLLE